MKRINLTQKFLAKDKSSKKLIVCKSISTETFPKSVKSPSILRYPSLSPNPNLIKQSASPYLENSLRKNISLMVFNKKIKKEIRVLPSIPKPHPIKKVKKMQRNKHRNSSLFSEKLNQTLMNPILNISQASVELTAIKDSKKLSLSFDYRTQIGISQGKTKKENQDSVFYKENFMQDNSHFFGVCDGHGVNGYEVVTLVRSSLIANIEKTYLEQSQSESQETSIFTSFKTAFEMTEKLLFMSNIEVGFSGCTSVNTIIINNTIYCANLGDSRAIIGNYNGKKCVPVVLTKDHNPRNETESLRILQSGGIIDNIRGKTYIDEEGNAYGPLRIWVKKNEYPGLAMTRCFGDSVSKIIGAISEPGSFYLEVTKYEMSINDRFMVIATDGIWEYLSNQKVVRVVNKEWEEGSVRTACNKLMELAIQKWKKQGEYMDDISFFVIFFKD
ncbi:hypothetical protein SteCoe_10367 [Stentor coeruleus]|uniref:PPM-type phosphatase domain-containing protein n=1 Tax=Stentor coeruleus TaxID=5963 RepID=A0A1R2CFU2_9CILI|nr:hypothetical protein SteCoe_10367 [Stentor coeruleus]